VWNRPSLEAALRGVCTARQEGGEVMLHRYMCLWGASERKLGKSLEPNQKGTRKNQGKRARHSATKVATPYLSGWFKKAGRR